MPKRQWLHRPPHLPQQRSARRMHAGRMGPRGGVHGERAWGACRMPRQAHAAPGCGGGREGAPACAAVAAARVHFSAVG
eukprot:291657-Chlamydomonas_euryale.AAC.1